mgnify:CR=1 FL=1
MLVAVCSDPWQVGGGGEPVCPGTLSSVATPVGWTMDPGDVSDVLTATLVLFAAAFVVRTLVRFVLGSTAGRE